MDGIAITCGLSVVLRRYAPILFIAGLLPSAHAATVELGDYQQPGANGDARPAFEQALTALAQPGYDRLHIPPGTYRLSAPADSEYHLTLNGLSAKRIDG